MFKIFSVNGSAANCSLLCHSWLQTCSVSHRLLINIEHSSMRYFSSCISLDLILVNVVLQGCSSESTGWATMHSEEIIV